jgi:hypothetical protein
VVYGGSSDRRWVCTILFESAHPTSYGCSLYTRSMLLARRPLNPEKILLAWARKRGRGYWRTEDRRVEECGYCHGTGWAPGPFQKSEEWSEEREGMECPRCKGSCIALKALKLLSEGKVGD